MTKVLSATATGISATIVLLLLLATNANHTQQTYTRREHVQIQPYVTPAFEPMAQPVTHVIKEPTTMTMFDQLTIQVDQVIGVSGMLLVTVLVVAGNIIYLVKRYL